MKRRNRLLLVTLFMALMASGKGGWQVHLSEVSVQLNVNQYK